MRKVTDRFKFRVWNNKMQNFHIVFSMHGIVNDTLEGYAKDSNFVLEQSTGLKDKNGKLVYEGDIVKHSGQAFIVEWRQDRLSFVLSNDENLFESYDITHFECEVIGNIHENPELLEQSNDD